MAKRWSCALLWLSCTVFPVWADGLSFSQVTITLGEDNRIFLDAQISYELNDSAAEALENGVPLTFVTHVQMRAVKAWVWDKDIVEFRLRSTLRYRPLSSLYEVRRSVDEEKQVFATRASAMRHMGLIRDMALVERARLDPNREYLVRLESYLDIEALPLPMRPLAYLSPEWDIDAEPWEWRLRP